MAATSSLMSKEETLLPKALNLELKLREQRKMIELVHIPRSPPKQF